MSAGEASERRPLVGVLGGGQLARMMALAGLPLGFRFRFLEPSPNPPVRDLGETIAGAYDDPRALEAFVQDLDAVTYEFENVPNAATRAIEASVPVLPPIRALETASDRLEEKEAFLRLGIPTAPYRPVANRSELDAAVEAIGLPAILKTRWMGYDGKGQWALGDAADVEAAWAAAQDGPPLILERKVTFRRELSVVGVRGRTGRTAFYPLSENEHRDGVLSLTRSPVVDLPPELERGAQAAAGRLLEDLRYVGVLALELFDTHDGLLANEFAPRVHNSGHWTQDGAGTCQFENHLRAIAGFPLGSTAPRGWSGMVNLLGSVPEPAQLLAVPGTSLHLYDKGPRPRRKLGHVNVVAPDPHEREARLKELKGVLGDHDGDRGIRSDQAAQASQSP